MVFIIYRFHGAAQSEDIHKKEYMIVLISYSFKGNITLNESLFVLGKTTGRECHRSDGSKFKAALPSCMTKPKMLPKDRPSAPSISKY